MPSFYEFLVKPWMIFTALFSSSAQQTSLSATPGAGAAVSGAFCQFRDVGGGDWMTVCRALGYEMPAFIFAASIGLLLFAIFAKFQLWRESRVLAAGLGEIEHALEKHCKGESIHRAELQETREMLKKSVVVGTWSEFCDLLVGETAREPLSSPEPLSALFSKERLFSHHLNQGLYAIVPATLTGLGLLMTFIAILDGLSHVSVGANMDVKGIAGLINGLSGKFFSSIVAILGAVGFTLAERILLRNAERTHARILRFLQQRVPARSASQLLLDIKHALKKG